MNRSGCLCVACLQCCGHSFLHSPPCSLPSLEGLSSWPAPRQPSGTATPTHSRQHKTSASVKQSGNIQLPGKYFKPDAGGGGLSCPVPIHNPMPWTLQQRTRCIEEVASIKRQMLQRDMLALSTTTARAAAQQQSRLQLSVRDTNKLGRINCYPSYCRSSAYAHMLYEI